MHVKKKIEKVDLFKVHVKNKKREIHLYACKKIEKEICVNVHVKKSEKEICLMCV